MRLTARGVALVESLQWLALGLIFGVCTNLIWAAPNPFIIVPAFVISILIGVFDPAKYGPQPTRPTQAERFIQRHDL